MISKKQTFLASQPHHPINDAAHFIETRLSISTTGERGVWCPERGGFEMPEEAQKRGRAREELWAPAKQEAMELVTLIDEVNAKLNGKSTTQSLQSNFVRGGNWDSVMQAVQATGERWRNDDGTRTMVCIDRIGRNSEAFNAWLQFLPSGEYGSSICGAFSLLLNGAKAHVKIKETIYEGLAEIPEIIANSRRSVDRYLDLSSPLLEQISFELCRAVIRAMIQIMRFFCKSSASHIFGAIVNQSNHKQGITDSINEVHKQAERLRRETEHCSQMRHEETHQLTVRSNKDIAEIKETQAENFQIIYKLLQENLALKRREADRALALNDQYLSDGDYNSSSEYELSSRTSNQRFLAVPPPFFEAAAANRAAKLREAAQTALEALRFDPTITDTDTTTHIHLGERMDDSTTAMAKAAQLAQHEVFKRFVLHHHHHHESSSSSSSSSQTKSSSCLLVNGHDGDGDSNEPISPLSYISAQLASAATTMGPPIYVLKYFCEQHRPYDPNDYDYDYDKQNFFSSSSPVQTMMASLLGQLITQMLDRGVELDIFSASSASVSSSSRSPSPAAALPCNLPSSSSSATTKQSQSEEEEKNKKLFRKISQRRLKTLLRIFRSLVTHQLPPPPESGDGAGAVVFCILDDLGQYETGGILGEQVEQVVRGLIALGDKDNEPTPQNNNNEKKKTRRRGGGGGGGGGGRGGGEGVVFKLLVTCRERAGIEIERLFRRGAREGEGDDDVLDLDGEVEVSDFARFEAGEGGAFAGL